MFLRFLKLFKKKNIIYYSPWSTSDLQNVCTRVESSTRAGQASDFDISYGGVRREPFAALPLARVRLLNRG